MFPHTEMTEHLIRSHGVTPRQLRKLWERRNPDLSVEWDDLLEVNHDLLHSLRNGEVVRGYRVS
jgi:hypothetical protein